MTVSAVLGMHFIFAHLIVSEDFFAFIHFDSFKSCVIYNHLLLAAIKLKVLISVCIAALLSLTNGGSYCIRVFCFLVSPSIAPFTFGEKAVNAGQLVQQNCAVTEGDEPLNITWTLNGVNASTALGIYVLKIGSKTSILTIESVRAYHGGNYTCTATNLAGSTHFTAYLAVNGIMSYI